MSANQASERWWSAFCHMGTIVADCICGRIIFASGPASGDYEVGELEKLQVKASAQPDKYIELANQDSVSKADTGHVWGCTCGGALKTEQWLDQYRDQVLSYYKACYESEKTNTDQFKKQLEGLI